MPKADAGNKPPGYPSELRTAGVEGEVVVKLHVHRDGTVKGAEEILRSSNTATGADEQAAADKAFKAPSSPRSRPGSTAPPSSTASRSRFVIIVNFPFKLTAG